MFFMVLFLKKVPKNFRSMKSFFKNCYRNFMKKFSSRSGITPKVCFLTFNFIMFSFTAAGAGFHARPHLCWNCFFLAC